MAEINKPEAPKAGKVAAPTPPPSLRKTAEEIAAERVAEVERLAAEEADRVAAENAAKAAVEPVTEFGRGEKVPSDWNIEPDEEGIRATHRMTGRVFVGDNKTFSRLLRS